jgi:glucose dehydrogenase
MVLSLLAWGAVRFFATLRAWNVLVEFGSSLSPVYLSITGAGWGVAGGVLLWSLFAGKQWSRLAILTSISVWLIEYWVERVYFQSARANLPFAVVASIFVIGCALASTFHKSTRNFLTRSEEYEQQNENPDSE